MCITGTKKTSSKQGTSRRLGAYNAIPRSCSCDARGTIVYVSVYTLKEVRFAAFLS